MEKTLIFIILGLLAAIIVIVLIINAVSKKKNKGTSELMPKLDAWVKQAKASGYNYTQTRTLLEINDWDKKLVKEALKNNGFEKPEGYIE